jgi:ligand-binding sensor domain-containing protein
MYAAEIPNNAYSSQAHAIHISSNGDVWIGHIQAGISWLEASTGIWHHITTAQGTGDIKKLQSEKIRVIIEDRQGLIHLGTDGGGITTYNPQSKEWTTAALPGMFLGADLDPNGEAWFASSQGVYRYTGGRWSIFSSSIIPSNINATSIAFANNCTCPMRLGMVAVGTAGDGLYVDEILSLRR